MLVVYVGAGPLEDAIVRRARERGVRVAMLGFRNQTQLPELYAASDVFVLPSDTRETWGLVVDEAMAAGLPVAVSDAVGCAPDLVDEGETGFCFGCGDPAALAVAMERVAKLAGSSRLATALARKLARRTAAHAASATLDAVRGAGREGR